MIGGAGQAALEGPFWWQFKGPQGSVHRMRAKKLGVEGQETVASQVKCGSRYAPASTCLSILVA